MLIYFTHDEVYVIICLNLNFSFQIPVLASPNSALTLDNL